RLFSSQQVAKASRLHRRVDRPRCSPRSPTTGLGRIDGDVRSRGATTLAELPAALAQKGDLQTNAPEPSTVAFSQFGRRAASSAAGWVQSLAHNRALRGKTTPYWLASQEVKFSLPLSSFCHEARDYAQA